MQTTGGIDLSWWITAVELPAMAGLFWIGWRNRIKAEDAIHEVRRGAEIGLAHQRQNLDAYKLDVAKNYVSISYLKDIENRLTRHLIRIEKKLDIRQHDRFGDSL